MPYICFLKEILFILLFIIVVSLNACVIHGPQGQLDYVNDEPAVRGTAITFSGYYTPPTETIPSNDPNTDKNNYRFKIVSRELLETDSSPDAPAFGHYAYLIFGDQTEASYPQRKAAAQAFMCEFEAPKQSRIVGLNTKNSTVFYAPIKPGAAPDIKKYKSGDVLLSHYNYRFAQTIISQIKHLGFSENFSIGIIALPFPLEPNSPDFKMPDELEIISLDNLPPSQIGATIRKLRQALIDPDHITAIKVPEHTESLNYPLFIDITVDNFSEIFSATLKSVINFMSQIETAEMATIRCN